MNTQAHILKSNGLKVTLPRLKVLEIFEHSPHSHLSADEVYRKLVDGGSDIGIATVYRILMQFADAGMLRKSSFDGDRAVFELEHGHHHDHLVCVHCGKVVEFFNPLIEEQQNLVAQSHGFKLLEHTMALYGVCDNIECKNKAK